MRESSKMVIRMDRELITGQTAESIQESIKIIRKNGQGIMLYKDGSKWTGEWKNGDKSGFGTKYAADGTVLRSGNWVDGKYVRQE